MNRTIRIKLNIVTPEQSTALQRVLQDYTLAFNAVCEYGFANSERNGVKLHHATYYNLKSQLIDFPAQLLCSARTKATEALKSAAALTKAYPAKLKAWEARKAAILAKGKPFDRRPPRKPSCPRSKKLSSVRYDARSYWVKWDKCEMSLATHTGRIVLKFDIPAYAQKYITAKTHIASSDLLYRRNQYWLNVVVTLPAVEYTDNQQVVGVDLGLVHPAVASTRKFLGRRRWAEVDRKYFSIRRALQSKGTKSAKRHLKSLAGRQQRFHRDCDHVLSRKRIVQCVEAGTTIVIENLTEIRSHSRNWQGETRRRLHGWSFCTIPCFSRLQSRGSTAACSRRLTRVILRKSVVVVAISLNITDVLNPCLCAANVAIS